MNSKGANLNLNLNGAAGEDKHSPLFLFVFRFANR